MSIFIQDCIYYLEEKHKDLIASRPKLYFKKFAAGAKGLFKLRPRAEIEKFAEKNENKLVEKVKKDK